ncbi:ATPase of 26S proteasome regulatory subunit 4 [Ophidiomyces ophidiicola]|nr:ATPase of 26S proteasome regulatory subunit 4 [Ophidiomyces ophidiicola]
MGNQQSQMGNNSGDGKDEKDKKKEKPKYEPPPQPTTRIGRKKRKAAGPNAAAKLPTIYPTSRCKLRYLRMQRIHDHLLLEEEYVENQERIRKSKAQAAAPSTSDDFDAPDRNADERGRVDDMRGSPMGVGNLEEMIDDDHAIISSATGPEYYVSIMSFVDKDLLEPGASILLHHKSVSVVGVLTDDADPLVSVMKLESQIQEVREAVELPLLHPELYEEMGIKPPKGVILYGGPGTGKTLLAKAVANQTSATFLRIVGSELIQKYLGDGPRLVRQIFQVAAEHAPSIVFIDEIDAIGTKRYESTSGGEREVQRTMLELLNQLDGFDDRGDVKVIMATNKIETLDPALIRPGRIDRKILFENPDQNTKKKIFALHTSKMSLSEDVDLDEFIGQKDDLSGADIKAICSEAGLMALRERRMRVQMADFRAARERVMKTKSENEPEGLYL